MIEKNKIRECSKLSVSGDDRTSERVMSGVWEGKGVAKSRGNGFRCYNRRVELLLLIEFELDDPTA